MLILATRTFSIQMHTEVAALINALPANDKQDKSFYLLLKSDPLAVIRVAIRRTICGFQ